MMKRIVALALLAAAFAWAVPSSERATQARGPVAELVQQLRQTAKARTDGGQDAFKVLVAAAEYGIENLASMLQDSSGGSFTVEYRYVMAGQWVLRRPDSLLAAGVAAIVTFTDYQYYNATQFGDSLAKFVDLGGGVVITVFADYSPWNISGRFATQYMPVPFTSNTYQSGTLGTVHQPTHPIMQGVTTVGCGNYKTGATSVAHPAWTTRIADWVGGQVEAAAFDSGGRRVAWLGFFGYGNWIGGLSGQWCRQMINAIRWVSVMHDVGCSRLAGPSGLVDSGMVWMPACSTFNYGNQTENYWVKMRITPSYDESAQVTGHLPGTARYFTFPNWTAVVRGNYTTRCSTVNVQDNNASNDHKTATGFVRVRDCGVLSLSAPSGLYQRGEVVAPAATWHNWGNVSAGFEAWMKLHDPTDAEVYAEKVDIASLLPGANIFVTAFPNCTLLTGGRWYVRCSTYYAGDQVVLNDVLVDSFEVSIGNPDIGVMSIVAPAGNVDTGEVVTPQGRVKNYGDVAVLFRAWFVMNDPTDAEVYREYVDVSGLGIGAETTLVFPDYNVGTTEGGWTTRCSVATPGDVEPDNDFRSGSFTVSSRPPWPAGWDEVTSMPAGAKAVKDGGWLAIGEEGGLVYGARGNKVGDFYSYDAMDSAWAALTAIPNGSEGKSPYKGAAGCVAGNHIYATKGNSTLGFWRYSIDSLTWTQMPDVPLGPSGKKVKGGTDMVYVTEGDTGFAYLLKGYKQDFFRFNTVSGVWDTSLPPAPAGARPKWDKGSWCGLSPQPDPPGIIFCHKAKYHELWAYDVATRTWGTTALPGMPLVGMMGKSKKSKDGGSAAYYEGALYALKGGNTQEFWKFTIATSTWSELDTMPSFGSTAKKKRVKAGGDIVSWGGGVFFAFKGNKTNELWRYVEAPVLAPEPAPRAGAQAGTTVPAGCGAAVVPGRAFRYSLPGSGPVCASLFDVTGREVLRRAAAARTGTLDLSGLSAGVYLARFEGQDLATTRKLVID